jgi:hypothetical protein
MNITGTNVPVATRFSCNFGKIVDNFNSPFMIQVHVHITVVIYVLSDILCRSLQANERKNVGEQHPGQHPSQEPSKCDGGASAQWER